MDGIRIIESKKYIDEMCKVVDIENPERLEVLSRKQLEVIFEGLLCNIDCIDYFLAHPSLNEFQMDEVLDGMRYGVDYTIYADESIDWKKMMILKILLINGFTGDELESKGLLDPSLSWFIINIMARDSALLAG